MINIESLTPGFCFCYQKDGKTVFCRMKHEFTNYEGHHIYCDILSVSDTVLFQRETAFSAKNAEIAIPCPEKVLEQAFRLHKELYRLVYPLFFCVEELPPVEKINMGDCYLSVGEEGFLLNAAVKKPTGRGLVFDQSLLTLSPDTVACRFKQKSIPRKDLGNRRIYKHIPPTLMCQFEEHYRNTHEELKKLYDIARNPR